MPFVLIHAVECPESARAEMVWSCTEAVCEAYDCPAETVTVYIQAYRLEDYGHAGAHAEAAGERRTFVQVHALPRTVAQKRSLARAMSDTISRTLRVSLPAVAIYFHDCCAHDVAHGGEVLEADPHHRP